MLKFSPKIRLGMLTNVMLIKKTSKQFFFKQHRIGLNIIGLFTAWNWFVLFTTLIVNICS